MPANALQLENLKDLAADLDIGPVEEICDLDDVRIPHIRIDVFTETGAFADVWTRTAADRRLVSTTTRVFEGSFEIAVRTYCDAKTPDLVIVETTETGEELDILMDGLAEVCDPTTQLVIVGHINDITLYQKLIGMGVADYLVYPVSVTQLVSSISHIYQEPGNAKIGKITAVIGAKGGVGASSVAQNLALEIAQRTGADALLVDMDLRFGTASLNLDVEPNQGLIELIDQAERLDVAMLDRVLVKCGMHLNLLSTAPSLESDRRLDAFSVERILGVVSTHVPHIVLDIPHVWEEWSQRALADADQVIVVATPDLGCLRNAASLMTQIKALRPNDPAPRLVLNQVGMPRRQEISGRDVEAILKIAPMAEVPFDPRLFSRAAGLGKMVADFARRKPVGRAITQIADALDIASAGPQRRRGWRRRF